MSELTDREIQALWQYYSVRPQELEESWRTHSSEREVPQNLKNFFNPELDTLLVTEEIRGLLGSLHSPEERMKINNARINELSTWLGKSDKYSGWGNLKEFGLTTEVYHIPPDIVDRMKAIEMMDAAKNAPQSNIFNDISSNDEEITNEEFENYAREKYGFTEVTREAMDDAVNDVINNQGYWNGLNGLHDASKSLINEDGLVNPDESAQDPYSKIVHIGEDRYGIQFIGTDTNWQQNRNTYKIVRITDNADGSFEEHESVEITLSEGQIHHNDSVVYSNFVEGQRVDFSPQEVNTYWHQHNYDANWEIFKSGKYEFYNEHNVPLFRVDKSYGMPRGIRRYLIRGQTEVDGKMVNVEADKYYSPDGYQVTEHELRNIWDVSTGGQIYDVRLDDVQGEQSYVTYDGFKGAHVYNNQGYTYYKSNDQGFTYYKSHILVNNNVSTKIEWGANGNITYTSYKPAQDGDESIKQWSFTATKQDDEYTITSMQDAEGNNLDFTALEVDGVLTIENSADQTLATRSANKATFTFETNDPEKTITLQQNSLTGHAPNEADQLPDVTYPRPLEPYVPPVGSGGSWKPPPTEDTPEVAEEESKWLIIGIGIAGGVAMAFGIAACYLAYIRPTRERVSDKEESKGLEVGEQSHSVDDLSKLTLDIPGYIPEHNPSRTLDDISLSIPGMKSINDLDLNDLDKVTIPQQNTQEPKAPSHVTPIAPTTQASQGLSH